MLCRSSSASVLTGNKFEKLEVQGETLDRVKSALDPFQKKKETLKPKVKKTERSGVGEWIFVHGVF